MFGSTGYIGGRLVPELVQAGREVRAVARHPDKLSEAPWRDGVEIVTGDVTDPASVDRVLDGQDVVYYLVHALHHRDFVRIDREAAHLVADLARAAGVRRIVYLGGIAPPDQPLSPHLASRAEVGEILLGSRVPTAVLRAAIILGSGSASFEMLRYLTERLPAMVTPRWVHNRVQPIAIRDVLHYLVAAADLPPEVNRGFDIGGPDVLSYLDMMRAYASVAGLPRRVVVPVPVLTPWLSAQWVNLVTPVPRSIAVPLIESLVNEVVCREHDIARHIPDPDGGLTGYERAIELAIARIRNADVDGPARRRRWPSPRTAGSRAAAAGRGTGLVARGSCPAATAAAAAGRDAPARSRLAGTVGRALPVRRWLGVPPARDLRTPRARRPPVLAGDLAVPLCDLRPDGPQHHGRRAAPGRRAAVGPRMTTSIAIALVSRVSAPSSMGSSSATPPPNRRVLVG